MRKTTLSISVDEEKAKALRLYLERKDSKLEDEIIELFETLYTKIVPAGVREYIGMANGEDGEQAPTLKTRKYRKRIIEEDGAMTIPAAQVEELIGE